MVQASNTPVTVYLNILVQQNGDYAVVLVCFKDELANFAYVQLQIELYLCTGQGLPAGRSLLIVSANLASSWQHLAPPGRQAFSVSPLCHHLKPRDDLLVLLEEEDYEERMAHLIESVLVLS
jgi:hypothetical protein